jgi:lipid-A-disaccharide synthase
MVIIYRVSPLTYAIGIRLIKVEHFGICNIVAGEGVVRELLQHEAEPVHIADEIGHILTDPDYAAAIRSKLATVREKLGSGGGSTRAARLALEMIAPGDSN